MSNADSKSIVFKYHLSMVQTMENLTLTSSETPKGIERTTLPITMRYINELHVFYLFHLLYKLCWYSL